ncbi:50S ribosomal protein L29 [Rubritalea profundi]|uniref:Large ribosomal subunit protein uL29 n=1 Tax=Rubritalea profundi TaxID=1658618 RepID=A0A2S7U1W5_9BACT|nr:50S ribosomal protein L29 [Rubritalea profundi]PQJ28986.1 50S ribosomal protein L29 [Rubritalea profundi]
MSTQINDIRELSVQELSTRLRELKQEALTLRLQQATGQLENTARIKAIRREVARVNTVLTELRTKAAK